MKFILKQTEPQNFLDWKNQERQTLENYYQNNATGSQIWDFFPNSPPIQPEEPILYYSKAELKEELLKEQGSICCYCNQTISNDSQTVIEHLNSKDEFPEQTLSYNNLTASCNGNQRELTPRELHCDANKSNHSININPLDSNCEVQLYFIPDGQIQSHYDEGWQTIKILNLNIDKLIRNRGAAIEGFIYLDSESATLIDEATASTLLERLVERNTNVAFTEFCSAVTSVISREILNQKIEL